MRTILGCLAFAAASLLPCAAGAQTPTYAHPSYASDEETIHGRIVSMSGEYDMQVRDDRGFVDAIRLHQGTVINPTGLSLAPGMSVTVMGYNRGRVFEANEIDTPYTSYAYPGMYYPYYPYYYPYYPYYPHTNVIIAPSFGWGWGWHGGYHHWH